MPSSTFNNLPPEKRDKLINCALDEFAANDYQSASISKIVKRAGIAKGSFYQYFSDKRELYTFLLELGSRTKGELLASAIQPETDSSFFDELMKIFTIMGQFETRHPKLARIGYRAATGKSPLPKELLQQSKRASIRYFSDLILRGISRGEIREDLNVETAAYMLSTLLADLGNFIGLHADDVGLENHATHQDPQFRNAFRNVLDVLMNGISIKKD